MNVSLSGNIMVSISHKSLKHKSAKVMVSDSLSANLTVSDSLSANLTVSDSLSE